MDVDRLRGSLSTFSWSAVGVALLFSSGNYALRFLKWELCLGWLGIRGPGPGDAPGLSRTRSALVYLAGLSMSITPGKMGEVLRSLLLRSSNGVSFMRTAPIVVADRLTDLVALVLLSLLGVARYTEYLPVVALTLALVVAGIVVLGTPRLFHALIAMVGRIGLRSVAARAEALVDSSAVLLRLRPLLVLSGISVLGWGLECAGYYFVMRGFAGVEADLSICAFLWATTTLIGALSFLPGGLGATEGSLSVLAARLIGGVTAPTALASTLLIRAATLWYAVLVGAVALGIFLRDPAIRREAEAASVSN